MERGLGGKLDHDWHVDAGTWEVGIPTSGPGSAYNGENCAATILDGNYPPNAYTRLIRHTSFQVPDASDNPRLRFWHWFSFRDLIREKFKLKQMVVFGKAFQVSWKITAVMPGPMVQLTYCLADATVQIGFYFHSEPIVW